jgi:hypothetical protein
MKFIDEKSLANTINLVSEALMFGFKLSVSQKSEIADFIVQQKGPEAYANTFEPTALDLKNDLVLFTGEKIRSRVGKCHMIGEEACRTLRKLNIKNAKIKAELNWADQSLKLYIEKVSKETKYPFGMYCCKTCSCALWLNLASGGLYQDNKLLKAGLGFLKKHRDNKGGWKGFPRYYVLYVLNETDKTIALDEMKYASAFIEKKLNSQKIKMGHYALRRNYICEQILKKVNAKAHT